MSPEEKPMLSEAEISVEILYHMTCPRCNRPDTISVDAKQGLPAPSGIFCKWCGELCTPKIIYRAEETLDDQPLHP